ncbi:GGDEF domain-containing protein [Thermotoga sp. Ku-13t]|uniref:GGDEF domain-containing protein n=1 Tax=Thermotoga sp. Ku-13t TaxID=1755813 RepID=UPI001F49CE5C|nr:GGDEF domain-containing protein [Thermotoga sp. Ku-13t]
MFVRLFLTTTLIVVGTILVVILLVGHFHRKYVFEPLFKDTVTFVSSYIDQWQRTVKAFDASYNPIVRDLLNVLASELETYGELSDEQITEILTKRLETLSMQYIERVNWYLISPSSVIERTNYATDLGLDIASVVPRYWAARLEPLKPGQFLIEGLSFEYRTNLPRIYGYRRLSSGWILEIGLALDPVIVADLWESVEELTQNSRYVERISLYGASFAPFGNYPPLDDEEKQCFSKQEAENDFVIQNLKGSRYKIYKNWIPTTQAGIDWSGKSAFFTLRVLMVLDFSETESMKKALIVFLSFAVAAGMILILWLSLGVFRKISEPIKRMLVEIKQFQASPLDESGDHSVETSIKEISKLQESIQDMKKQIRDQLTSLYLANRNLRQDIEKYKLDIFIDPLTRLFNRRFLMQCLEDLQRSASNIVICFLDIDSFKMINDTYGHHVGDIVLKTFVEVLRSEVRKTDLAFRIGGDEFMVLFPELQIQEAQQVVERIEKKLPNIEFEDFPGLRISVSYGFSRWSKDCGISIEEALKEADLEMYRRKKEKYEKTSRIRPN